MVQRSDARTMMNKFSFCILLNLLCVVVHTNCENTVKVSLYYESLCPDCMRLIKQQLYPVYKELRQYIELDLVPYGNAKRRRENNKWVIDCQHGEEECYGNKMQACVLASNSSESQKNNFVGCTMSSRTPASISVTQQCAHESSLNWDQINTCARGNEGDLLLAHYGEETDALRPPHKYVPWILFNGVFNETMNAESQQFFLKVVCSLFEDEPAACPKGFEQEEIIIVNLI